MESATRKTVERLIHMMSISKDGGWVSTLGWPDATVRFNEPNWRPITEADIIAINIRAIRRGVTQETLENLVYHVWDACGDDNRTATNAYADMADGLGP